MLLLQKQLTKAYLPLLTATELLRKLTLAHLNGLSSESITIVENAPGAWFVLQKPDEFLNEGSRGLCLHVPFGQDLSKAVSNTYSPSIGWDDTLTGIQTSFAKYRRSK